jgi:DNA-binding XRE family transcriptional regulator
MAKPKPRHKQKRDAKHVRLYWHEKECEAWQHASLGERCLYLELKYRYNSSNNGFISMSQREAAELLNVRPHTAGDYFAGLIDKGFIALSQDSAFNMKRMAREWRLTEYPCNKTGWPATKDYRRWTAPKTFKRQCRSASQSVSVSDTMAQTEKPNSVGERHYEGDHARFDSVGERHTISIPRQGGGAGDATAKQTAAVIPLRTGSDHGGASFGAQVREARQAQGIKAADLAKRAGIGRSTLSNIESGRYQPGDTTRAALLQALDSGQAAEAGR